MGFFDIFRKKKGAAVGANSEKIELFEGRFAINGKAVEFSPNIDVLIKMFGQPRRIDAKDPNRVNFAWDSLGLYCYTNGGSIVTCVGVRLHKGENSYAHFPTELYKGVVTINKKPWFSLMGDTKRVGDTGLFKVVNLGGYSVTFSYDDELRFENDCNEIEISFQEFDFNMII
ncbi:MAG: hypothetical protein J1F03_07410 [Oscillospiraceae bacterium]|nr:hypothetical protein [Oscillospiraceae bacterium]